MECTPLCKEIRALLDLAGGPLRETRSRAQETGSALMLTIAADLGRARQYLTDAESAAHAQCMYPNATAAA